MLFFTTKFFLLEFLDLSKFFKVGLSIFSCQSDKGGVCKLIFVSSFAICYFDFCTIQLYNFVFCTVDLFAFCLILLDWCTECSLILFLTDKDQEDLLPAEKYRKPLLRKDRVSLVKKRRS